MPQTCLQVAGRKKSAESEPKAAVDSARSFADNLKHCRKRRRYSQETLAARAEVHRTEISLLERAGRDPGIDVILKLSGALGIRPEELLRGATFIPAEDGRRGRYVYEETEDD